MKKEIRQLNKFDLSQYQSMQTGMEEDYMLPIFPGLTDGDNRLFGMFVDGQLVSTAGYRVFAHQYVMLGRLRSDERYRGQSHATDILEYTKNQALNLPDVEFVGANTERHNKAAQKVLGKIGLPHLTSLYGAQAKDLTPFLMEEGEIWQEITDIGRKREWLNRTYLNKEFPDNIFPFEAYYPFPASETLFNDDILAKWTFYENKEQTRFLILSEEDKGSHYLHITYSWSDFLEQPGMWHTIQSVYREIKESIPSTLVWIDLTDEEVATLPTNHPFELSSPWMLHGLSPKNDAEPTEETNIQSKLSEAYRSIEELEEELAELESDLNDKLNETDNLEQSLSQIETDLDK